MSKIIVLGDTHQYDTWKRILDQEGSWDEVIFIGDYFDSFTSDWQQGINNFLDIIKFKESGKGVTLLVGNHDFHYMPGAEGETYSGFSTDGCIHIDEIVKDNIHHVQAAYQNESALFTHAGVTRTWYKNMLKEAPISQEEMSIADAINLCFSYRPRLFQFNGHDPSGDNLTQGPFWVRPRSLAFDGIEVTQVVGHTPQKHIHTGQELMLGKRVKNYWFIDALPKEYLVIEEGEFKIKKYEPLRSP